MSTTQDILTSGGEIDQDKLLDVIDKVTNEDNPQVEEKDETTRRDDTVRDDEPVDQNKSVDDDWVSQDDIRELVASFGYSDEDMSEFQSRDEFMRHVKLVDRQFMRDGRELSEKSDEGNASERAKKQPREKGRFAATEEEYVPQLDGYEDELVGEFKRLNARYEERIQSLESRYQKETHRSEVQHFNLIADLLGHNDLFGKSAEIGPRSEQAANREKLLEATRILMAGIAARHGELPPLTESLVKRAANLEFADHLSKKQRKSFHDQVRRQAARRHGGGSQRASTKSYTGDPTKHPDLLAAYHKMASENG